MIRHTGFLTGRKRCHNKMSFDSRADANKYLRMCSSGNRKTGGAFKSNPKPYFCEHCQCWHLGTLPNKRRVDSILSEIRKRGDA